MTVSTDVHDGTPENATQLLRLIENQLGWDPYDDPDVAPYKRRSTEAAKINRKVKRKPDLYTWRNLATTVAYCHNKDIRLDTPMGLFFHVDAAMEDTKVVDVVVDGTDEAIAAAVALERVSDAPDSQEWERRLLRATGNARSEVLAEWRAARGVT